MANRLPLVVAAGQREQLQTGDLLVDADGHGYVDAASAFGASDQLIVAANTARGVQSVAIVSANLVTAASAFATDNRLLRSDGTGRGAQSSSATLADTGAVTLVQSSSLETSGSHSHILSVQDSAGGFPFRVTAFLRSSLNLAIGGFAGIGITTGTRNVIYGEAAGTSISSGVGNVCIGVNAGNAITTVSSNVFIGNNAGVAATSGSNVAIGADAFKAAATGGFNMLLGTSAGEKITSAVNNMGLGTFALREATTGGENTAAGTSAGRSITTGSSNVFVGSSAGFDASQKVDAVNSIAIGSGTFTTASNTVVIGNTSITATQLRGDVSIEDGENIVLDTTTGSQLATATSQKLGFWGATPIVQPASANQAALTLDTDVTGADTVDLAAINQNFTDLQTLVNQLRSDLVNAGLIKGSA